MSSNPAHITLPAGAKISISCLSFSTYTQHITVSIGALKPVTFSGSGEDKPMTFPSPLVLPPVIVLNPTPEGHICAALFQYTTLDKHTYNSTVRSPIVVEGPSKKTITINAAGNLGDTKDSQLKIVIEYPNPTNPTHLIIPSGAETFLSCLSNSTKFTQHVVITIKGQPPITFSGKGENVPMTLPDGSNYFSLGKTPEVRPCTALFTYLGPSEIAGGTIDAKVSKPVTVGGSSSQSMKLVTIVAEDGTVGGKEGAELRIVFTGGRS